MLGEILDEREGRIEGTRALPSRSGHEVKSARFKPADQRGCRAPFDPGFTAFLFPIITRWLALPIGIILSLNRCGRVWMEACCLSAFSQGWIASKDQLLLLAEANYLSWRQCVRFALHLDLKHGLGDAEVLAWLQTLSDSFGAFERGEPSSLPPVPETLL